MTEDRNVIVGILDSDHPSDWDMPPWLLALVLLLGVVMIGGQWFITAARPPG